MEPGKITIREIILQEMTCGPSRDFASRLEDRIHYFLRTICSSRQRMAFDAGDFHTAHEIQKLEDRLLLSPAPTETWEGGEAV